jgi:hypothetical protein
VRRFLSRALGWGVLVARAARARTRKRTAEREKARRRRAARTRRDTHARDAGRRASVGRWGRASRRRARTSGRGGGQARVELRLVAAGVCAFKYADANADAFVVALDGSPLAPGILVCEGYVVFGRTERGRRERGNGRARGREHGARRAHPRPARASMRSYSTATARGKVRDPPLRAGVSCSAAPLPARARAPSTAGTGARRTGADGRA